MTSEVGILLERIGLERYKDTLANHGMHTLEDLRQGKAVLALALPLGPKARLLKELNTTEGEASLGGDEYGTLINIVRPYMDILSGLTSKLAEAARRNPGGSAGKQYIIASTTLKLCEKVIRDSQRYQLLSKRNTSHSQADMASCKVSVGSSIRQLRQQQQQGIMRTLEEADPQCILPVLDLSQTTLGQVYKTTSPKKKNRTSSAVVDSQVIGQLKQLTRPPEQVKSTVYMMLKLFGYDELTWGDAKSRMGSHAFQVELANFNPSEIPDSAVVQLGEFLRDPETMANEVAACCHEAGIIALWMLQIYNSLTGSELKASEASIISPVRPAQNPTRTHAKSTPTSAGMGTGTGANNSQRSRKSTLPIEERERQLAEKEELLKRREEYIAEEEQRLKRKELDLEKSGKLSAQGGSVGDVLHQIEALKMMIEKAPVDRQLLSKVNSLSRAAATSRALLAYYSANKKRSVASEEVSDEIPVGSHVRLKVWNKGTVTGQHRGRIGVKIDKRHVGVVPQMLRRVQNELCPEEEFPIGTPVELGGQRGVVTGFARGRVGVELQDGAKVGVIPEKLRALSEDEVLGGLFPMGLEVVLLEKGTVAGCSRGRVGLVMSDGSQRGCIPEQLRKLPEENIKTAFPTGTKVVISASNTPATVTGYARGRLGLELEDGTKRGAIPTEVIREDSKEGLLRDFPIGCTVQVSSLRGEVMSHARGRIGVQLDNGETRGVLPCNLRAVELSQQEMTEKYSVGTVVAIGAQRGKVTGCSRGRIGVELDDGTKRGVIPQKLKILSEDEVISSYFPAGLEVVCLEKGTVAGCSRGRVGLVMSDGSQRGCIPEQLRKLPEENIKTAFPTGTKVVISASNTPATVTGYARGRLGLELEDGTKRGAIPTEVIREDSKEGLLRDFPIGCTVQVSSLRGEVMSHARGRIGVQLDNGETRGVLPCNLRAVELSQQEMTEKYSVGTVVAIGAQRGKVTGCSRGRIGVELDDGTKRGVIPQKLRILTAAEISMNSRFDVGAEVEVLEEPEGHVVGKGRGRLGVMLADGRKVGCMLAQATVIEHTVSEDFPVGCHVDVMLKGKVTGCSRGRVGIELPGGAKVGCLPNALRKTDTCQVCTGNTMPTNMLQDFAVGSNVMYEGSLARVTGHSRGRVGIEVPGRGALGVVPTALSTARKPVVCYHQLKALAPSVQDKTVEELMEVALDEHHTLVTEVYSLLE